MNNVIFHFDNVDVICLYVCQVADQNCKTNRLLNLDFLVWVLLQNLTPLNPLTARPSVRLPGKNTFGPKELF